MSMQLLKKSWVVLLLAVGAGSAQAAMLPYSDTVVIQGTHLGVVELALDAPGNYSVTATDLKWFDTPLQALSFGVFTATTPIKTMQGAGTLEFFNAAPGKVFLQLFANAGGPRGAGLVSLQATFADAAVVPLPASSLLLGSALLAWGLFGKGRRAKLKEAFA